MEPENENAINSNNYWNVPEDDRAKSNRDWMWKAEMKNHNTSHKTDSS